MDMDSGVRNKRAIADGEYSRLDELRNGTIGEGSILM
jgi:hypothetical protein